MGVQETMSKKEAPYLDGVKLIKSKTVSFKKTKIAALVVSFLVLTLILLNTVLNMFSLSMFSVSNIFGGGKFTVKASSVYMVVMDKTESESEADRITKVLISQGASGYVWKESSEYYLIGSVYLKKDHAKTVSENLSESYPNTFVKEVKFKKVKVIVKEYNDEQNQLLVTYIKLIDSVINELNDYSIKIESGDMLPTTVASHVNQLKSQILVGGNKLDLLNVVSPNDTVANIKTSYVNISEILHELVLKLINNSTSTQSVKYSYVSILQEKQKLFTKM